ncbi:MAG: GTPase Era [Raineya sp.]|jgi:GTP-binding protein Era|nr:GTPase Era [Raineya sp.]
MHKAGFVNIIGKPNAGKSTLMNALMGEKLSIITSKAQTTRHRITGILTGEDYQIVYSDTPGIIDPKYPLQKAMMNFVQQSLEDADILLWVIDATDTEAQDLVIEKVKRANTNLVIALNKIDLIAQEKAQEIIAFWQKEFPNMSIVPISALNKFNTDVLLEKIKDSLPEHPAYYDEDTLTDKSERFFASEIIREKIFLYYDQEIPYSTETIITSFKETETIIRIQAEIIVERDSQKGILIGKGGKSLKKVGVEARKDMEAFFGKQVHLEQFVKVEKDWRKQERHLSRFGYILS